MKTIMKLCYLLCDCIMHTAGKEWIKQVVVGASLFPATVSGTAFLMNLIAIYYHASRAIPFLTMVHLHDSHSSVCVHYCLIYPMLYGYNIMEL